MNYINGKFVEDTFSEGEMYGVGVFETILVEDGSAKNVEEHYKRTKKGCEVLGIKLLTPYQSYEKQIQNYIDENSMIKYAMRVTISKRSEGYDLIITSREIAYTEDVYKRGFRIKVTDVLRNPTSPLTYIKDMNYSENLLVFKDIKKKGYDEAIFLNPKGEICEGAISNIFFKRDGIVKTPRVESGILPGIMRKKVIERYKEQGVKVEEGSYTIDELLDADEVFVTNSLMGVMPVREIII